LQEVLFMPIDIQAFYLETLNYFQNNINIAIAIAGILVILLIRKTKLFFVITLIVAVNVAALFVISKISSAGINQKSKLINESVQQLTEIR
jgi:hypothetical protein